MPQDLTDEDRAAIRMATAEGAWLRPFSGKDVEAIYRAGLAAGRARAIEDCKSAIAALDGWQEDIGVRLCAAAIRALLK